MNKKNFVQEPLIMINGVRTFSGFSYLMTHIVRSFYHFILLPSSWSKDMMFEMARLQVQRNRLDTYLLLSVEEIVYFPPYGEHQFIQTPPGCSIFWADKLQPAYEITQVPDLQERKARLNILIERIKSAGGYVFGDVTKGGRRPTPEEVKELNGLQENGVPKGLVKCPNCGFYRGTCIDTKGFSKGLVVKVHCLCENDNLCARCGQLMYEYKLNANFFDEKDKVIWHVPGFSAFLHKCPDRQDEKEPDKEKATETESGQKPDFNERRSIASNNQNNEAFSGNNQGVISGSAGQFEPDNEMELFPLKPEQFNNVGDWFRACRSAGIMVPVQLGHAVSQVEEKLGLKWPESFYILRRNRYVEILAPNMLSVRLNWNKLIEEHKGAKE